MRKFSLVEKLQLAFHFLAKHNSVFRFPRESKHYKNEYKFKLFKRALNIAYFHTKFYRDKYDKARVHPRDIRSLDDVVYLPTTTKTELIEYNLDFIDSRLNKDRLILTRSSGSSGHFVNLYYDHRSYIIQALQVVRMIKSAYPGYSLFDRELLVYTSEYPYSSVLGFFPVVYINNLEPAANILNKILSLKPSVISIYPSILREILNLNCTELNTIGVKLIITNSEQSSCHERNIFSTAFGCPVIDEFSSEELGTIAYQCSLGNYHFVEDCSHIELLSTASDHLPVNSSDTGEIVGTNLINYSMPIIRYRQGDQAVLGPQSCRCGNNSPTVSQLLGRINSSFICQNKPDIPSGRILDWIYSLVLNHNISIKHVQVVQTALNSVRIALIPGRGFDYSVHANIMSSSFKRVFGDHFCVTITTVDNIQPTSSGKFHQILSLVSRD